MSTFFLGVGNIGSDPELKKIDALEKGKQPFVVCNLSVRFKRFKPSKDAESGFEDKGGFWADVAVWGNKAQQVARLLKKGAAVCVKGELYEESWQDKEGNEKTSIKINADGVYLLLNQSVEEIVFAPKDKIT